MHVMGIWSWMAFCSILAVAALLKHLFVSSR